MKSIKQKTRFGLIQMFITTFLLMSVISEQSYSMQDTVILPALQDNTLYENAGGLFSNGQGKYMFSGKGNTGLVRRSLLRFLLIEFIPPCSKVLSVSVKMHLSGGDPAFKNIQLKRLTESWGEGSSDAPGLEENGTTSAAFDATWLHQYYNTDLWTTQGGTYSPVVSGSSSVGGPGFYTWSSPQMAIDVQNWLTDFSTEFGWIVIGDESASSTAKRFHTSEADTVSFVPEITVVYETSVFSLYLEAYIEGFWDGTTMTDDTMTVKLHNTVSPFAAVDSAKKIVKTFGGDFCFYNAAPGDYYISVHHRNSIETWSKLPVTFNPNGFEYYNFKDAETKAYGDNQTLRFAAYCIYGGDQNKDDVVDITDVVNIYNDANIFLTGYVQSDMTGDDLVDITDILLAYNNANNFVSVMKP